MDQDQTEREVSELKSRIRLLEERIQGLRASRRILMNLLSAQERERRAKESRLLQEKERLQQRTTRFARAVLERNVRILRLEDALRRNGRELS